MRKMLAAAAIAAAAVALASAAHADPYNTPDPTNVRNGYYLHCLQSNGVNWQTNPNMYLSVGQKVYGSLISGKSQKDAVSELIREGADPREAVFIVACSTHLGDSTNPGQIFN
jgi:hypothetical protein